MILVKMVQLVGHFLSASFHVTGLEGTIDFGDGTSVAADADMEPISEEI